MFFRFVFVGRNFFKQIAFKFSSAISASECVPDNSYLLVLYWLKILLVPCPVLGLFKSTVFGTVRVRFRYCSVFGTVPFLGLFKSTVFGAVVRVRFRYCSVFGTVPFLGLFKSTVLGFLTLSFQGLTCKLYLAG